MCQTKANDNKVKQFARMIFMKVENSGKAEKIIQRLCKGQIKTKQIMCNY